MYKKLFVGVLFFTFCLMMKASSPDDDLYLTPGRLFHIARSINRNLVCYDVNTTSDGKLNTSKPINVYWINREERMGEKNGLNFFQRKMAYGYKVVDEGDDSSTVTLTAYSGCRLKICRQGTGYVCRTTINGKPSILKYIYVKVSDHNPISADYIELHGITLDADRQEVTERIDK